MENKSNKILLSIVGIAILIVSVVGVTYAFFNYTRTGEANTLSVGRISFNHTQNGKIELSNVFPTSSTNLSSTNSDTVTINITGDTTYTEGIEYKVTLEEVNNTINNKEVPISFNVTASNLGTKDTSYYINRGGDDAIYNLTEAGEVEDGKYVLVGYIPSGSTGVNGSIDITAFIDSSNVAISDTVSRIENGNLIYGETTGDWVAGRTILTTSEWNSFQATPVSFKVKVEANEGIWVEEEKQYVLANLNSNSNWTSIRATITSIEFHSDGAAPTNPVTSFDATDITSEGPVTVYIVDDGLNNNTRKAIVVAENTIYAPENSVSMFRQMSKLTTFNSENFRVDNVTNMSMMFARNSMLNNIDSLSLWNTSNVESMAGMFALCGSINNVDSLLRWNVSNVTNVQQMFQQSGIINVDGLINWNVSSVITMAGLFVGCYNLISIDGIKNWNTINVTSMDQVFANCTELIDFTPLINWNVLSVETMALMFGMDNLEKTNDPIIDFSCLSKWNVSNVVYMNQMFQDVNVKSYLPFKNWNVSNVQNFKGMFNASDSSTVTTLSGLENWNVVSSTNMSYMFADNKSLTDASAINNWNISANNNFDGMFVRDNVHPEFTKVFGTWDSEGTFIPNA